METAFIDKLIGEQDARLLRDRRAGETLKSETSECGSPPAPRKASNLERKSTTSKNNKVYENSLNYKTSWNLRYELYIKIMKRLK